MSRIRNTDICTVCKGGRVWGSGSQTDELLPQSPFAGQLLQMATFCVAFCEFYLSTVQCKI